MEQVKQYLKELASYLSVEAKKIIIQEARVALNATLERLANLLLEVTQKQKLQH